MAGAGVDEYTIEAPDEGFSIEAPPAAPPYVPPEGPAHAAARRNFQASQGTITPAQRAADPTNQAILTGLKYTPSIAAAMVAPEILPELGPGAGLLAKAGMSGAGAGIGNVASQVVQGQNPVAPENLWDTAKAAGWGTVLGGVLHAPGALMRTGIFGEGLANYFAETPRGGLVPKDEARDIQRIHEAIGVKPGNMNIGLGATTADDAYNLPGRAIKAAGFKPQDFEGLTPFEQAEKLKPVWNKAGQAVSDTAAKATKNGVTFDGAKSLTQAIGDMLDPEGSKALKMANDTAKDLGITNWRKMTPDQAVELKQALWQRLPGRFKGPVYGALTRDLNTAVPEMVGVNRNYTELRSAMDAISDSAEKYMSRASPTKFDQMLDLLRQHPAIAGATGLGTTIGSGMGAYQGGRALYDWVTGR
jgi:hypothetical protein